MAVVRLILFLVILAGLAVLGLQNLSPAISLVFLGARSQPIPLAFLILGAIAAGMLTGLVILGLLRLLNYFTQRQLRSQRPATTTRPSPPETTNTQNYYQDKSNSEDDPEDYAPEDYASEPRSYEAKPGPRTGSQSGSSYSYSYRDSTQSGVGRRESVYDADYREVTPPKSPEDADDGFDDEDFDFEDDSPDTRR